MLDDLKDNPLAAELLTKRASAYFGTAKKMEKALEDLRNFDRQRSGIQDELEQRRECLLAEAAESAWFFLIHRESLKLPYYDEIWADFEIPDEVRRRVGPKKIS